MTTTDAPSKMEAVQAAANARYDAIRNNRELSREAITKRLAQAHVGAQAELDALKKDTDARTAARQAALSSKLLSIGSTDPSASISYRDAQDRVAAIKFGDTRTARDLLERALQSGDSALAKALLHKGLQEGDSDLVNQYTAANPSTSADVEELWTLQHSRQNQVLSAAMYAAPRPTELWNVAPYKIEQIANS